MRFWSFLIIAAVIAFPRHVLNATDIGSPPLPPPRPTEQPLHRTPQDNAPAEQYKPNPAIDQACLDRLGDDLITFEAVTLPLPANPRCAIETPVRLKAAMSSQGKGPILLPDKPTVSCHFGERFGHWLRDLVAPLIFGELAVELKSVRTVSVGILMASSSLSVLMLVQRELRCKMRHAKERKVDFWA
jgi:hypothetical protein